MRKTKKVKTKMKFLKVIVKNFKPYLDETIIPLYTSSNADAPITAIVGPNGTGKTSICDAVLWAIYGKEQEKDLAKYTNNIAKQLTEAKKELRVPVSVKLDLEIDGTSYQIVRNSIFNIQKAIIDDYKSYVSSFIQIQNDSIKDIVESDIELGKLWPAVLLRFNPSFHAASKNLSINNFAKLSFSATKTPRIKLTDLNGK